jgi:alkylation response protein AidB-like acyl-CoA dehydrogenase
LDFALNEDQRMLQETVQRFVNDQVKPKVGGWDREAAFPRELTEELAGMGLMGVTVSADWDGVALGLEDLAVVAHELARGDAGLALAVASHNALAAGHLDAYAGDALRDELLKPLARGERLGAWAVAEAGGLAPEAIQTQARRDGNDWLLDGTKVSVTLGTAADVCITVAATGDGELTAFAVDGNAEGLERSPQADPLGARTADHAILTFTEVRVADKRRIGEPGQGAEQVRSLLDRTAVVLGALAVGVGRAAIDAAAAYANERKQFNQPIGAFKAIQWKLADAATDVDAAALLVHRAATLADAGRPFSTEAAMARLFAARAAQLAADHCVQIHGGFGYTADFPAERIYRDAQLITIVNGARGDQRSAIARSVIEQAG